MTIKTYREAVKEALAQEIETKVNEVCLTSPK